MAPFAGSVFTKLQIGVEGVALHPVVIARRRLVGSRILSPAVVKERELHVSFSYCNLYKNNSVLRGIEVIIQFY